LERSHNREESMILSQEQLEEEAAAFEKVKKEQGGFSHPQERTLETEGEEGAQIILSEGMTIHMEFAKAAMEGMISAKINHDQGKYGIVTVSKVSLEFADAMIKAYQERGWL